MNRSDSIKAEPAVEQPKAAQAEQAPKAAKVKEEKAIDLNTVEGQKEYAKQVDQGESARELLEQAVPYIKGGSDQDYAGSPERWKNLKERIEAYLVLNKS